MIIGKPIRNIKEGPFAWFNKRAFTTICEKCEESATAVTVYMALCNIASDRRQETFQVSQAKIADMTKLSRRTVWARLQDLEKAGVIRSIRTPNGKLRETCLYALLSMNDSGATIANQGCATIAQDNKKSFPILNNTTKSMSLPTYNNNKKKEGAASGDALLPFDGLAKPEAKKPESAGKSRKRDCAFEALMEIEGYSPGQQLLRSERGKINRVLKEIREVYPDVTGEEIRSRFEQLKRTMPWCKHTATSLVKHWSKCEPEQEEPLNTYQPVRFVMPPRERPTETEPEKPSREMQEAVKRRFDQVRNLIRNLNKNDGANAN